MFDRLLIALHLKKRPMLVAPIAPRPTLPQRPHPPASWPRVPRVPARPTPREYRMPAYQPWPFSVTSAPEEPETFRSGGGGDFGGGGASGGWDAPAPAACDTSSPSSTCGVSD